MDDWTKYVPSFNKRGIFIIALLLNVTILAFLSWKERNIYKFISITIFGIIGISYWSQDTPSIGRDYLCIIDKCNCYITLSIFMWYFEYFIQYIIVLLIGGCYILEFIMYDNWVIYHIGVHFFSTIVCISTFYLIL